ncbi:MAG TPA: TadE/TadG family type IV pilus assembly protein [Trebonia sp.]|nr:TadE/TadG family type IV pilus assembly protein [Trebonia sp.]
MTRRRALSRIAAPRARGAAGERGSMSVELAVIVPALLLLMLLVVLGGHLVEARGAVDGAARDAARAASLARYPGQGTLGATSLADQAADGDLQGWCANGEPQVTVTGFPGAGNQAQLGDNVTVNVTCDINTSIFGLLDLPARFPVTGTAVAPLDPYMCRGQDCEQ